MTNGYGMRASRPARMWAICLLMPLLMGLTLCSRSYAEARLTPEGEIVLSVEDARLLLGEVRGLQAENSALREALASEREDVDRLIAQTEKLMESMEAERKAWQERLAEERRNARKNGLIMFLVGAIAGGMF